jgi:hypothetical protein
MLPRPSQRLHPQPISIYQLLRDKFTRKSGCSIPLPASLLWPRKTAKFRCRQAWPNRPFLLIYRKFLTLRGRFRRPEKCFVPEVRDNGVCSLPSADRSNIHPAHPAIGFSSWTSAQWLADHEEPTRQGSRHRQNAPYQRMQTQDGYLMIGAAGAAIWARCAQALGHPEWCEDPRFATNQARMANSDALEDAMNELSFEICGRSGYHIRATAQRRRLGRRCSPGKRRGRARAG